MVLDEVNEQRFGKNYADEDAAIEILGSPIKKPLTKAKSPFLLFFEYGENREGYWTYSNMAGDPVRGRSRCSLSAASNL
jgi:hypothetical protein